MIGSVLGDSSQRAIQCRIAAFLAGIPENVPVHTVNRCGAPPYAAISNAMHPSAAAHASSLSCNRHACCCCMQCNLSLLAQKPIDLSKETAGLLLKACWD